MVNSGTSALILGLMTLGIGKGDEVILPSHTFIASANAVLFTGATPIFAEIQPNTYTVDCESIESLITPSTKAVMPVHIYGHPCDMLPILDSAEDRNLFVIEDACQAHGASIKAKMRFKGDVQLSASSFKKYDSCWRWGTHYE